MSKEYCRNCRLEIDGFNWKISRFRCHKCYGRDDVANKITQFLELMEKKELKKLLTL